MAFVFASGDVAALATGEGKGDGAVTHPAGFGIVREGGGRIARRGGAHGVRREASRFYKDSLDGLSPCHAERKVVYIVGSDRNHGGSIGMAFNDQVIPIHLSAELGGERCQRGNGRWREASGSRK